MKRLCVIMLVLCCFGATQAQVGVVRSGGYGAVKQTKLGDNGPLTRSGKLYFYQGKPMKEAEMVQFLNENCAEAYKHYRKNQKIEYAGWGLFGAGALMAVGLGPGLLGGAELNKSIRDELQKAALSFFGIGAFTALAGIPMIIVGNKQKKNAHRVYNIWCGNTESETSQLELQLTPTVNGIGLTMTF